MGWGGSRSGMYADDIAGRMSTTPPPPPPESSHTHPAPSGRNFLEGVGQYLGQKIRTVQWNPRYLPKPNGEPGEASVIKYGVDDRSRPRPPRPPPLHGPVSNFRAR